MKDKIDSRNPEPVAGRHGMTRRSFLKAAGAGAAAAGLGAGFVSSCTRKKKSVAGRSSLSKPQGPAGRVFVIGLDGLDRIRLDKLFAENKLPNLKRLQDHSAYGAIRDEDLFFLSPVVWNTIATGRDQREHGIRDFRLFDNGTERFYTSLDLGAPPIWEITGDSGLRNFVVGWYTTSYAQARNSVILSDRLTLTCKPDPEDVYPPDYRLKDAWSACSGQFGFQDIAGLIDLPNADYEALSDINKMTLQGFMSSIRRDNFYHAATMEILRRKPAFDMFMVYLRATDSIGHIIMKYVNSKQADKTERMESALRGSFDKIYEYTDRQVGEILKYVKENDYVIAISDHGFGDEAFSETGPIPPGPFFNHEFLLRLLGYVTYTTSCPVELDEKHTSLYKYGMKNESTHKLLLSFDGYDEYAPAPGKESETISAFLRDAAEVATQNGKPLISNHVALMRNRPWEQGKPAVVKFNTLDPEDILTVKPRNYPVRQFLRSRPAALYHRFPGVFMIKGPGVATGELKRTASYYSVAPTLLYLMGRPVPENMDGRAMHWLFNRDFTARRNVVKGPPAVRKIKTDHMEIKTKKNEDKELQRLKELGYIQ